MNEMLQTLQIQPDKKSSTTETQQPHSKYLSKQRDNIKDIQVNTQPCGFDRRWVQLFVCKFVRAKCVSCPVAFQAECSGHF